MTPFKKTVFGFASENDAAQANALIGEMPGFEDCTLVLRDDGGDWFLECYDGGARGEKTPGACLRAPNCTPPRLRSRRYRTPIG